MLEVWETLNETRSRLLTTLGGLSDEQLNWKPDDATWSIAQVVQHIAIVQSMAAKLVSLGLAQEANFSPKDLRLNELILDRTRKANAPERSHPSENAKTLEQLRQILQNSHEQFVSALKSIEDASRLDRTAPPVPHPIFGQLSTGQWIEAAPLHEERHIQQIEEVKARLPF